MFKFPLHFWLLLAGAFCVWRFCPAMTTMCQIIFGLSIFHNLFYNNCTTSMEGSFAWLSEYGEVKGKSK